MQWSAIFLWEIGCRTWMVQGTTMRAAVWSKLIRTAWKMDGLIRGTFIGGGTQEVVNYQSSVLANSLTWWGINHGPSSVIPSLATMSNLYCAFSHRYYYTYLPFLELLNAFLHLSHRQEMLSFVSLVSILFYSALDTLMFSSSLACQITTN